MDALEDIAHWKTRIAVGRMAFDAGFYNQAARHFRTALELLKNQKDPSSELLSINSICLAKALSCLGHYDEAELLINEALKIDTAHQENILQLALDYLELSSTCWKQHRQEQGETYAHKALELLNSLDKREKENHITSIARALKLIAIMKGERGDYTEAIKTIDKALTTLEHSQEGSTSQAYGEALMAKVMLLVDKGEIEQIEPILDDAIQIIELHKGIFHPQLAKVMHALAQHVKQSGKIDMGIALEKQAQEIEEKNRQGLY